MAYILTELESNSDYVCPYPRWAGIYVDQEIAKALLKYIDLTNRVQQEVGHSLTLEMYNQFLPIGWFSSIPWQSSSILDEHGGSYTYNTRPGWTTNIKYIDQQGWVEGAILSFSSYGLSVRGYFEYSTTEVYFDIMLDKIKEMR